jgi:hypothetical protein
LDTLYQTQRTENKDIDFILVEPNELYHPIARKLITSFSEKISIKSNIEIIKGFFPEKTCLEQVLNVLKNKNVDFMIFSLCNLLNWLNVIQMIRSCREFIDDIINKINPYYSVILSVETNNIKLYFKLMCFYYIINKLTSDNYCLMPQRFNAIGWNFSGSRYYVSELDDHSFNIFYYFAYTAIDSLISKISSPDTLKVAFYKARMALRKEIS